MMIYIYIHTYTTFKAVFAVYIYIYTCIYTQEATNKHGFQLYCVTQKTKALVTLYALQLQRLTTWMTLLGTPYMSGKKTLGCFPKRGIHKTVGFNAKMVEFRMIWGYPQC